MLFICLFSLSPCFGEENQKPMTEKDREKIHYILTLTQPAEIAKTFNSPEKLIVERMLSEVEKKNRIKLKRQSMMRTDRCVADLIQRAAHIVKVSTGYSVTKAVIELTSDSRKVSMYTHWENRNLEDTELKITLYYSDDAVEPTEFICAGQQYY